MKITGLLLSLAISPLAFSGEIITNDGISVLAVNGVKVESSFMSDNTLEVKDGKQQIAVRFSKKFDIQDNRFTESRPFLLNVDVNGETTISTDKLYSAEQAGQKIQAGLNWYVTNDNGKYQVENPTELHGKGLLPYSDIEALIADTNRDNNIDVSSGTVKKVTTNSLIDEYRAATVEQKKQFKIWLINNETR